MKREYYIEWQTPGGGGNRDLSVNDFAEIPAELFRVIGPPATCPLIITRVELKNRAELFADVATPAAGRANFGAKI